ncbi:MAG TPA: hypothetical protein VG710_15070 [Opitutus sp.]|nr:hypothetical protein [Opitutus sp.]
MSHLEHPRLRAIEPLAVALDSAASAAVRAGKKAVRRPHRRAGGTLTPGVETPLWNELAAECAAHLAKRGDKVGLARVLGLPRQRVHQLLVARSACPDAERTLQLLVWLSQQRPGRDSS